MKRIALLAGIAVIGLPAAVASAELCRKCKGMAYIMTVGQCVQCGGTSRSGAFKLCGACSLKLGQCECCRARMGRGRDVEAPPARLGLRPPRRRQFGKWQYVLYVNPRYRRVKYSGHLRYDGQALTVEHGQWLWTPWGRMTYLARGYDVGWMPPKYPERLPKGTEAKGPDPATSSRVRQRYTRVTAALDRITFDLSYRGPISKPYYSLRITTLPEHPATYPAFWLQRHVRKEQAGRILDGLTTDGFLARAMDALVAATIRVRSSTGPGYSLTLRLHAHGESKHSMTPKAAGRA